jgi:hypothetical protein
VDAGGSHSHHSSPRHVLALSEQGRKMGTPYTATPVASADRAVEAAESAVSWPAIFAGTAAAIATSLVLLALGSGLGFASISPWAYSGAAAGAFTTVAAIWIIVVQWIAAGLGAYITGRLRSKWADTHTHEVFFRDTAHGLVTWALATSMVAILAASATSWMIAGGIHAAAIQTGTTVGAYEVDTLFRGAQSDSSATDERAEATRILAKGLSAGEVPGEDRRYLANLIATRTGMSQDDAQKRVDGVVTRVKEADVKVRQAADAARKGAAAASLVTALAMVIGAFVACAAAALGGHERNQHP